MRQGDKGDNSPQYFSRSHYGPPSQQDEKDLFHSVNHVPQYCGGQFTASKIQERQRNNVALPSSIPAVGRITRGLDRRGCADAGDLPD